MFKKRSACCYNFFVFKCQNFNDFISSTNNVSGQVSGLLSFPFKKFIIIFLWICWFWLANVSAFSDVYWMFFRLSIMLLNSNAWLLNCSRRVSKSWMKPSEISLIWLSYSFVLVSLFLRILLKPLCWSQV